MGFNKRFLSEDSIRSSAKNSNFHWFQRYMVYADAYIIDTSKGDWASKMYHQFGQAGEDSEERRELHRKIANDEI